MTPRLLVTGSSHVGALLLGWKAMAETQYPLDIDFFAAPISIFKLFERSPDGRFGYLKSVGDGEIRDGRIEQMERLNGGFTRNLGEYTHTAVIGYHHGSGALLKLVTGIGVDGVRPAPPGAPTVSRPFFDAAARSIIAGAFPHDYRRMLTGTQICISAIPLTAGTASPRSGRVNPATAARLTHPRGIRDLIGRYHRLVSEEYAKSGMYFLDQPLETITEHGTTELAYNRGSQNLKGAKKKDDPTHMNALYGELCMRRLIDWVLAGSARQAIAA